MKRQFEFLTAPSALQVELAVAPDPGPGAGREVVRAVRVERRRRLAAAGRPGHVRRDHLAVGGGDHEAARLRSLGTKVATNWSQRHHLAPDAISTGTISWVLPPSLPLHLPPDQ